MDKARIYIDLNEMVTDDIVLLSAKDTKEDSLGNNVTFYEGMPVNLCSDDESDLKACQEEELAVTKRLESYCLTVRRVCGLMTYLLSSKDYKTMLADSFLLAGLSMKKAALECQINIAERIGNPDIFVAVVYHMEWNQRFRWTPALCLKCGDAFFHVFYHAGWICRECGCNNGAVLMPMAEADPVFYKRREQECWKLSDKFRKIPCKNCGRILQNHLIKVETC